MVSALPSLDMFQAWKNTYNQKHLKTITNKTLWKMDLADNILLGASIVER